MPESSTSPWLVVASASGDGWAFLFLVLTPLLLGVLFRDLIRALGTQDVLILRDGRVEYRRRVWGAPWSEAVPVEAIGVSWTPASAENADSYFPFVTLSSGHRVMIRWNEDLEEIRRLGTWITEQTRVPFDPDPVRRR